MRPVGGGPGQVGVAMGGGGVVGVVVSGQVVDTGWGPAVGGHAGGRGDHTQGAVETCKK